VVTPVTCDPIMEAVGEIQVASRIEGQPLTFVKDAFVAGMPSAVGPKNPPPPIVLIVPLASTLAHAGRRPLNQMNRFPARPRPETRIGSPALVAGPAVAGDSGAAVASHVVMIPLVSTSGPTVYKLVRN